LAKGRSFIRVEDSTRAKGSLGIFDSAGAALLPRAPFGLRGASSRIPYLPRGNLKLRSYCLNLIIRNLLQCKGRALAQSTFPSVIPLSLNIKSRSFVTRRVTSRVFDPSQRLVRNLRFHSDNHLI
jgi:hypothetical protein